MKRFLSVFMAATSLAALGAMAQAAEQPKVEKYTYATQLDIARVISVEDPGNVCEVVPVHMVYEDHQGQRHVVEYSVMGKGCQGN
ncbi:DUF2790 domain-containing protein [Azotobacter chroococcum subsp. isscasi]|uniref:DUF2790 domain-containing protein n=1 Tax=Azotobacter chroococcum TaxID=353 RepID=UPI00103E59F5|nr:DUF2790 domain-containing protein [Azotobacter chroococcum]TBW13171.1 DUF2790 domain-containing protein [Azotobacter chroococcum subsp. isscasi]